MRKIVSKVVRVVFFNVGLQAALPKFFRAHNIRGIDNFWAGAVSMSEKTSRYVRIEDREIRMETPVGSCWPIGDGVESEFCETERRRYLIQTIHSLSQFARNEGYPLASILLTTVGDDLGLMLFTDYRAKGKQAPPHSDASLTSNRIKKINRPD